jgi:cytochrome P450
MLAVIPPWETYDPTSQEYWEDPIAYYLGAPAAHPVFLWESRQTVVVVRYDDVVRVLQDFQLAR